MHHHNSNFYTTLFIITISLCFAACGKKEESAAKGKGSQRNILRAEAYVVTPQEYNNIYTASGSLVANEQIDVHPEVSGRVTSILFKEGTRVGKGQTLVQLNDADIRAQVQKLKAQRSLQAKTLERQGDLLKIGGISRQDYETTQTQIASIDADIAYNEAQMRKTKIVAPFDGIVGIRSISVGSIVSPETVVASLQQPNPLKMDFTIPDQYRSMVRTGQAVFFTVDGVLDTLEGKIMAIDPGADATTRTVRLRAIVPNNKGKLVPGSFAHVIISLHSDNDAILIPSQAIIPTTKDKKVAVVRNGKAEELVVILGDRTESSAQVLSGLHAGDTVIITGIMQVRPGMDVAITKLHK